MKKIVGIIIMTIFVLLTINYPRTYQIGDINKDGKIDVADAILILRYLEGNHKVSNEDLHLLDFNQDGAIDQSDAEAILQYIVGAQD